MVRSVVFWGGSASPAAGGIRQLAPRLAAGGEDDAVHQVALGSGLLRPAVEPGEVALRRQRRGRVAQQAGGGAGVVARAGQQALRRLGADERDLRLGAIL